MLYNSTRFVSIVPISSGGFSNVGLPEEQVTPNAGTSVETSQDAGNKVATETEAPQDPSLTPVQAETPPEAAGRRKAGRKKVIKRLAVGQQLQGTVSRIADFGAFVDIGVGRDGLVHISEMGPGRVNKVSDVLTEGQKIDVWIKELDREKNRISLSLCKPPDVEIENLQPDMTVKGTVSRIVPYGAFVDIGTGREALLHVREMAEGYVKSPSEVVSVGDKIEARILKVDLKTRQVDLSIKETATAQAVPEVERAEETGEPEEEVPTAMELALREALATEGKEPHWITKRRQQRRKKEAKRRGQEDILSRTLNMHRKWDDEK